MKSKINRVIPLTWLCIVVFLVSNCSKKSSPAPIARSVVGYWVGKFADGGATPTNGFAFLFRPNGTVRVYDDQDTASGSATEGTYALTDSTVTTTYSNGGAYGPYNTVGVLNSTSTQISGSWGDGGTNYNGGIFYLDKVQ